MASITAAYDFKYFPRYGKWTKEMQMELDEHSRRMVKLMNHVQDLYKSNSQKKKDQQREDTDADCMIAPESPVFSQSPSTSPAPESPCQSTSPQVPAHQEAMPMEQNYPPVNCTVYYYPTPAECQYSPVYPGIKNQGCTYYHH
ncbi:Protein CBG17793 [Caenorhabditis briggsae]|uniref:Protein CBG17793 n=2 Tax=Caenorhabditis briggsae TaxID=6238 RepID=A8XRT5_CAEBR|nr:Protein CBG17793 [Caenorhabditis briggsae]CAP35360.1 Protein CBG17793 [Caenorhabditis briggsae]